MATLQAGIDYGSKLAGTTCICFESPSGQVEFLSSVKGQDADSMILGFCASHQPHYLFLDAPLSLPAVYAQGLNGGQDYFYRACDKELKAMSPMFLGGLTARAMKLAADMGSKQIEVFETYPKWQAQRLGLQSMGYKGELSCIDQCLEAILKSHPLPLSRPPATWHEFDALLALLAAYRYTQDEHLTVGDPKEGLIYL